MRKPRWLFTHILFIGSKSHQFPPFAQPLPIPSMGLTSRPFASLAPDFDIPSLDSTFHVMPLLAKHFSQSRYISIPSVDSISPPILEIAYTPYQFPLLIHYLAHSRYWQNFSPIPAFCSTAYLFPTLSPRLINFRNWLNISQILSLAQHFTDSFYFLYISLNISLALQLHHLRNRPN